MLHIALYSQRSMICNSWDKATSGQGNFWYLDKGSMDVKAPYPLIFKIVFLSAYMQNLVLSFMYNHLSMIVIFKAESK